MHWDSCKSFMLDFMERPLNYTFKNPADPERDNLPNYYTIVQNPMDLTTVKNKLFNGQYQTTAQWYRDVCLIYENAIAYHTYSQNQLWIEISKHLLKEFQSQAKRFNVSDEAEWNEVYKIYFEKLGKAIEKSKVPQGIDDLVQSCIKRAESMPPIQDAELADLGPKLKALVEDESKKLCVLAILKKTQKDLSVPKDSDTLTIELDKLNITALNVINLYVRSFDS